jgi:hypothetical protein
VALNSKLGRLIQIGGTNRCRMHISLQFPLIQRQYYDDVAMGHRRYLKITGTGAEMYPYESKNVAWRL